MVFLDDWTYGFGSFVHGRLPYQNLKPDPVLRNLLLSLPYRKIVSPSPRYHALITSDVDVCVIDRFANTFLVNALLHNRSLQMLTRFTPSKFLVSLDWRTVLRGLYALRLSIPFKRTQYLMMRLLAPPRSLTSSGISFNLMLDQSCPRLPLSANHLKLPSKRP